MNSSKWTHRKKVPVQFPGCVELLEVSSVLNGDASKVIINPEYRSEASKEFFYFVTHILPAMNPSVSNYKRDKNRKLISETFSVADEAFGLVMLYNEYDVWAGNTTTVTKENGQKKKFLDSKSGRKDG